MAILGSILSSTPQSEAITFAKSLQTATADQTVFSAGFDIQWVFVDSVLNTTGYSGQGTKTITFTTGLTEGQEVYLTT